MNAQLEYYNEVVLWKKGGGATLLLDEFPNAVFAFSLRKLRGDYGGYCIKVRRSNDNATQDIGFVSDTLDTASLLSFVGSNNGFVEIFYCQGIGNNAIQTTLAKQPMIVNSGVVVSENGLPCLFFNGGNNLKLNNRSLYNKNTYSLYFVTNFLTADSYEMLFTNSNNYGDAIGNIEVRRNASNNQIGWLYGTGSSAAGTAEINNIERLLCVNRNSNVENNCYVDNTVDDSSSPTTTVIGNFDIYIGSRSDGTYYFNGNIKEIIGYDFFQITDDKNSIHDNINTYYSIY